MLRAGVLVVGMELAYKGPKIGDRARGELGRGSRQVRKGGGSTSVPASDAFGPACTPAKGALSSGRARKPHVLQARQAAVRHRMPLPRHKQVGG